MPSASRPGTPVIKKDPPQDDTSTPSTSSSGPTIVVEDTSKDKKLSIPSTAERAWTDSPSFTLQQSSVRIMSWY
ncbi:hypothetical protein VTJ49DRAFT_7423 [Mycothermus thermophilus]|uniref:Uncharacterized protein n=1 Tax=Humicola insolens TaxID=85995 RepID=A0ABR3VGZ6_HUMIN